VVNLDNTFLESKTNKRPAIGTIGYSSY
jgi:hypothetical protein